MSNAMYSVRCTLQGILYDTATEPLIEEIVPGVSCEALYLTPEGHFFYVCWESVFESLTVKPLDQIAGPRMEAEMRHRLAWVAALRETTITQALHEEATPE